MSAVRGVSFKLLSVGFSLTLSALACAQAEENFADIVASHVPVIIRNATNSWPYPPSAWSEAALTSRSGEEVVDVAFTEADGHLNRFEPMEKWEHVFKDAHWKINDVVLARPKCARLILPLDCLPSGEHFVLRSLLEVDLPAKRVFKAALVYPNQSTAEPRRW